MEEGDVREFNNALISIRGNSLRYKNSVFSVSNIVSLTFDSVRREHVRPYDIQEYKGYSKWWLKYFFFALTFILVIIILEGTGMIKSQNIIAWGVDKFEIEQSSIKSLMKYFILSVTFAIPISIFTWLVSKFKNWHYENNKYYYVNGLRVIFTNNMAIYFIANNDSEFIEDTLRGIESFIAEPLGSRKKEMTVNFSNNSIQIDEVSNSNVIGGDVAGGIGNG